MKSVSDNFAEQFSIDATSSDGSIDGSLLGRIGDDLRHLYGEVVDADLPRSLMELAQTIDARRASETGGD